MSKVVNEVGDNFSKFTQSGVVVVDFWANWCGPCRMLAPILDTVSMELDSVNIGKVDVDKFPEIAKSFNVSSIPNVCIFKDGQLVDRIIGMRSKDEIINTIKKHQ